MNFFKQIFGAKTLKAIANRAGYAKDQMGIQSRYVRESKQWESHLHHTKQYILSAAKQATSKQSVAILGSGWLLDVPLAELASQFAHVHLFDIIHPEPIQVKTRKMPNIHLHTIDLTGGAIQCAYQAENFADFTTKLAQIQPLSDFTEYDLVVSVNLLNQLDIILCDYVKKRFNTTHEQLATVRTMVQQNHIKSLPQGKTCLITDFCEENIRLDNKQVFSQNLLYCTLSNYTNLQEWTWTFDTNQTYHAGQNTTMKVRGVRW